MWIGRCHPQDQHSKLLTPPLQFEQKNQTTHWSTIGLDDVILSWLSTFILDWTQSSIKSIMQYYKELYKYIQSNSTGNKRQWLTPSVNPTSCSASPEHAPERNIWINAQCRRTPVVVSTHIIHFSKKAVPEKAQSWTNKTKCSTTLPKIGQHLFKFQSSFQNAYQHPRGCSTKKQKKTYILDELALAAVKSFIIHNA